VKHGSIEGLYMSAYPAFALLAGIQLDLFSALAEESAGRGGSASAAQIAARLGVTQARLEPLLDALVVAGLVDKPGERYSNGAEADRILVRGRPDYLGGIGELYLDRYRAALGAAQSIRENRPSAKKDFAAMKPAEAAAFFGGMHKRALNAGLDLARRVDFAGCANVVDAGGGSGGLAVGLCRALPGLRAAVADLAPVLPIARERIAHSGLADRIDVVEADLVAAPLPGRYDAAVVRAVLQVMSEEDAGRALANVVAAVRPGGLVCVIGRMLDDSRLSPEESVFFNLVFIGLYQDGRAYPEGRYRDWFRRAGVGDVRRIALAGGHSIVWGRTAG
jgi:DNA-binding transcriptional ArsR family regulator